MKKQTTQKQIEANRENALKGGVKTQQGKEITRFNALKHGILRQSISEYETLDFESVYKALEGDLKPESTIEAIVIERIALAYIKLLRVNKAEIELIKSALNPTTVKELVSFEFHETIPGYEPQISKESIETLSTIYSRYETSIENRLYRAIDKILELKNGR